MTIIANLITLLRSSHLLANTNNLTIFSKEYIRNYNVKNSILLKETRRVAQTDIKEENFLTPILASSIGKNYLGQNKTKALFYPK